MTKDILNLTANDWRLIYTALDTVIDMTPIDIDRLEKIQEEIGINGNRAASILKAKS